MSEENDAGFWVGPVAAPDSYRLVRLLGRGGEGEVWEAVLPLSDAGRRRVAIKVMPAGVDPKDDVRWLRHGHLLRSLSHPGLVRVTDHFIGAHKHRAATVAAGDLATASLGEDQLSTTQTRPAGTAGDRYLVMDLAKGVTLRDWVQDHPDARPAERLQLLAGIADALDEMHAGAGTEMPVAHGDVKPSNIIVRDDGSAVLVDMGLTRIADAPGADGRSLPYAAPELRHGGTANAPADRFAFYATAAHVLTGQTPPLDADTNVDLAALRERLDAAPATATRPALSAGILDALAADPDERPGPLGPWLASLTDTLSGRTTGSSTPAAVKEAARIPAPAPRRRRRRAPAVIAALTLVLAAGGTGLGFAFTSGNSSKKPAFIPPPGYQLSPSPGFTQTARVDISPDTVAYGYAVNVWSRPARNDFCQPEFPTCDPKSVVVSSVRQDQMVTAVCVRPKGQRIITGTVKDPGYDDRRWVKLKSGGWLPNTWFARAGLDERLPIC